MCMSTVFWHKIAIFVLFAMGWGYVIKCLAFAPPLYIERKGLGCYEFYHCNGIQWRIQKSRKEGASLKCWLINYSWVAFIRISVQEDPLAMWNSSASLANSVNQRRCLSCGPKKAVIYCIIVVFTKECVNNIMNINILVAEKGGPRPPGPIAGSATGIQRLLGHAAGHTAGWHTRVHYHNLFNMHFVWKNIEYFPRFVFV